MNRKDRGMTILEVMIAFIILTIGIGFMLMSNKAYYSFREDRQERQQMMFYAAGQMDAVLEGQIVSYNNPPFHKYDVVPTVTDHPTNDHLQIIRVDVYKIDSPEDPTPISIYTYRVKME